MMKQNHEVCIWMDLPMINGGYVGILLRAPTGELVKPSVSFGFEASNNEAKYEVVTTRLELAK